MEKFSKKGAELKPESSIQATIRQFFIQTEEIFEAVMMPMRVPAQDSYAWIMITNRDLLADTVPMAPIMPVNAAKAIKRFTRKGEAKLKIAVLIRPCEVRAAVELTKLNQINLDKVTIFSYDCQGALPMQDYINDPAAAETKFQAILTDNIWNSKDVKPTCQICDKFYLPAGDVHFAFDEGRVIAIANSDKGNDALSEMNLKAGYSLDNWEKSINEIEAKRLLAKEETYSVIKGKVEGFDNLLDTFAACIGCHNCQSACPICYCRQCYFDSATAKPNSDVMLLRAEKRGGLTLPLDRIMFHTGRMAHMSLSCVSCGLCSDACPVNIPVAKIFSYVGSQTQQTFEYVAGESFGDALPMKEYKTEELGELTALLNNTESPEGSDE